MNHRLSQLIDDCIAWIKLGRFPFLLSGILLHSLGVVIAVYSGANLNFVAILWGQIVVTTTQLMTHYANDYFDIHADQANQTPTNWSGGSRILVESRLQPRVALFTSLVFASMALAATVVLSVFIRPDLGTWVLLLTAQLLAWFYSAPPLQLHSRGLGEVTTAIIVTLLTPLIGYYLQTGQIDLLPLLSVLPLCCLQVVMLIAIEFPDVESDRLVNKRTLVVRWGDHAVQLWAAILVLTYAILPLLFLAGLPFVIVLAVAAPFPLALGLLWRMSLGDWQKPTKWNALGFYSIVLLMLTATAELGAFLFLIGTA